MTTDRNRYRKTYSFFRQQPVFASGGGGGGSGVASDVFWFSTTDDAIYTTGSVVIRGNDTSVDSPADYGSDVFFFVSGSTDVDKSVFGGSLVVSGSFLAEGDLIEISGSLVIEANTLEVTGTISATQGLSGSLTKLVDGTSYLVAGTNITITSQSNGSVTVSSTAGGSPGGSDTHIQYNDGVTFAGDSNFTYDYTNQYLSISGSVAEGDGSSATGLRSHAEGNGSLASGDYSHAEGFMSIASGDYSHSEGEYTTAGDRSDHAEGYYTTAMGSYGSHAEGDSTTASGYSSHAEGGGTTASGGYSHAEGNATAASGIASHAEGGNTQAQSDYAHAEGYYTIATGSYGAHAEGNNTAAVGFSSHAEGSYTITSGSASHAEGDGSIAFGDGSHAEGYNTHASGTYSHAGGYRTIASGSAQMAVGKYNLRDNDFSLFVVGNGDNDVDRSDVFRVNSGSIGNGRVEVTGSLAVTGSLEVTGSFLAQGSILEMTGTLAITGSFHVTGSTNVGTISEAFDYSISDTGTVSYNISEKSIFYVEAPAGNITANFTNVPVTSNRIITTTVILSQSATPRTVDTVQIDGSATTINWLDGSAPSGTANKQDVFSFNLIRSGSSWITLGQLSKYG